MKNNKASEHSWSTDNTEGEKKVNLRFRKQTGLGDLVDIKNGGDESSTTPKLLASQHDRRCRLQKRNKLRGKVWGTLHLRCLQGKIGDV